MIKEKITDYVFHTTFDSSITDITDKIFTANVNWINHSWANSYGITTGSDNIKVTWQHQLGIGKEIFDALTKFLKGYCNYIDEDDLLGTIPSISDIRFNKYTPGASMALHVDHIRTLFDGERKGIPVLSIIGLLNDDFIGGEFLLCGNDMKLKKNSFLAFPSNFMYPHEVTPIKEGTRYTFVAWLW